MDVSLLVIARSKETSGVGMGKQQRKDGSIDVDRQHFTYGHPKMKEYFDGPRLNN